MNNCTMMERKAQRLADILGLAGGEEKSQGQENRAVGSSKRKERVVSGASNTKV